jgi:hypothetical protein
MRTAKVASRGARLVGLLTLLLCAACVSTPRRPSSPVMYGPPAPVGFPATVRYVGADRQFFLAHVDEMAARVRSATAGGPLNILALSGGGAGGAFGAGALIGLSHAGRRPQFAGVTGVSTGALLAPFAYLGPDWDEQLADAFRGDRSEHLLRARGLGILFHPSVYRGQPLADLVDHFVTNELVTAVAKEFKTGRMLLVATTDLDKQETVIWDMGTIASQGGESARVLFRDVLVASTSIPGLFPPVLIHVASGGTQYDEMHVDGGTTVPFFFTSEASLVVPIEFEKLRGAYVYVLMSSQLMTAPQATRVSISAILTRSFSASLRRSSRTSLELSDFFAQRYGMNFRFTQIPGDYPFEGTLRFRAAFMRALFDFGVACGERGLLWTDIEHSMDRNEFALTPVPLSEVKCPAEAVSR